MNPTTFSALAEPHRLHILELLLTGPRPVNQIVSGLHLNQPQVSKHLRVLSQAGLVDSHTFAQQRIYQLNPQPLQELNSWIEKYRHLWETRFNQLDNLLANDTQKGGEA